MVKAPGAIIQRLEKSVRVGMRGHVHFEIRGGEEGGGEEVWVGMEVGGQWIEFSIILLF